MDQARCARRTARRLISLLLIVLSLTVFAVSCAPRPKFSIATGDVPALSLHPDVDATPEERVASDLAFLTSEFCNGRQVGTGGALKSAQYTIDEFERIGLKPGYRDSYVQGFTAKHKKGAQAGQVVAGFNVVGILGNPNSDPTVVICAHRDSLGTDGSAYVPIQGGTDNASGTAGLLEIARILEADREWKWATVFASFDGEEIGLTGSMDFASNYPFNESNLRLVVNLDCVAVAGCREVEIHTTPGSDLALSVAEAIIGGLRAASLEGVTTVDKYGSDHLSFEAEGFAALSIHSPLEAMRDHLHGPSDTVETVDASALATLAQAVADGLISGLVSGE